MTATRDENDEFFERAEKTLKDLFNAARVSNEVDFAFALEPEERGYQDPGWSSAGETFLAFDDYVEYLNSAALTRMTFRVAFSFYCHLSEAGGFYEIPKKLMMVTEGDAEFRKAFRNIEVRHRRTGNLLVPNANAVFRDLAGHATNLGFDELGKVFSEAFDPEFRNAYAHANYILTPEEMRIKNRVTNSIRIIPWDEFDQLFRRGIGFFQILRDTVKDAMRSYAPAKILMGKLNPDEPQSYPISIEFISDSRQLAISGTNGNWRWVIDARTIFADETTGISDDDQDLSQIA
ncbi:MAG: hypothetical protein J5I65_13370 [Aridibacter famidurans]|nr:hypothetical protein [Aridibacter famidurans]